MPTLLSNLLVIALFAAALTVTLWRGPRTAFVWLSLPCLFLLAEVPPMNFPFQPGAAFGAMYGILLGIILRGGEPLSFKWNLIDALIPMIAAAQVISSAVNANIFTGLNSAGIEFLGLIGPYFLARLTFQSAMQRRSAMRVLVFCIGVIAFFALIETRLWPHYYRELIHRVLGMAPLDQLAYRRYGFFRADSAFAHPIYLGNACLGLIGMVFVLSRTTAMSMRDWRVWGAMAAAAFTVMTSISYGSYMGLASAALFFLMLRYLPIARKMLTPLVILAIIGVFALTMAMRNMSTAVKAGAPTWKDSFATRVLIVQRGWKFAANAGLWGHGRNLTREQLGLESVDNAYLLFAMRDGWVYLALWLILAVALAHRAARAFATVRKAEYLTPLAGGVACLYGVMVAMNGVWAAWDFVCIWMTLLGFVGTLIDFYMQSAVSGTPRRVRVRSAPPSSQPQHGEPMILLPGA